MAFKAFQTSRPDKNKDRAGWNASWEQELKITYEAMERFAAAPSATNTKGSNTQKLAASMSPYLALHEERVTRDICKLQEDLVRRWLECMSSDNFERKWKELTQKRREELVLEGLYQASTTGPDMERHRRWCPDMTLENLAGNGGQGYIDMLMKLIPDDVGAKITEPTMIPHTGLERYYMKAEGSTPPEIRKYRAYFMDLTLWRILLAFYGQSEEAIIYKPLRQSSTSETREVMEKVLGDDSERKLRHMKREYKDDKIKFGAVNSCWSCGKDPSKLEPGQALKVCAKCNAIGRKIWYCSRECQTHDWKHGSPRPHKAICGKEVNDLSMEAEPHTKERSKGIPLPDPGFERSPALLHQISLLERKPNVDYVLINPPPLPDVGIALPASAIVRQVRQMFLIMRHRAFKSGDKRAARFLYQILNKSYGENASGISQQYPVSRLKEQFEREYGVFDLDSEDINGPDVTEEELAMAEELMRGV
ncbi:hypothetical protein BDZ97DRAFT_1847730 [Flammula alnicola]|nr:hypothetical protein BDZ97DRAFT_1847730 [Flammula alnicola]